MVGNPDASNETRHYTSDKGIGADDKTLQRLRKSCRITLEKYIDLASQSSGQLTILVPGTFDPLRRTNLAHLKEKEDDAHEVYLKARAALSKYIFREGKSGNTD
jgi:hypothetical protein